MLWVSTVQAAIEYLEGHEEDKAKFQLLLGELVLFLRTKESQIACYAVKHALDLYVPNNKVEHANYLVVTSCQVHDGIS